ncbi:MAG: hypothetical protein IPM97_08635 [Bdellovibrionaceae bacterium]|nr:hypothetical protein [Pseudobdellovibrionaceae bacterium]
MKFIFSSVITLVRVAVAMSASTVQAVPAPRSLEAGMKLMQARLKTISKQATDTAKNGESARLADEFAQITEATKALIPGEVDRLPASEREIRKDLYESMMDDSANLGLKLAEAFRINDNTKGRRSLKTSS